MELWPWPLSTHSGSSLPLSPVARLPHCCPQAHLARVSYTKTATHGAEDCDWLPAGPPQTSDTRRVLVPHPRAQPQALQRGHASLPLTDPSLRAGDFHQTAPTEVSLLGRSHRFSPCRPGSDAQHRGIISQRGLHHVLQLFNNKLRALSSVTAREAVLGRQTPARVCWVQKPVLIGYSLALCHNQAELAQQASSKAESTAF